MTKITNTTAHQGIGKKKCLKLCNEKASTVHTTIDEFGVLVFVLFFNKDIEYFLNITNVLDDSPLNIRLPSWH